jgi:hypothetical protein
MNYTTVIIGILIAIISILYYRKSTSSQEHFANPSSVCPEYLTHDGNKYDLYSNGSAIKTFDTYKDYMDYFNFTRSNYISKGISCKPLVPIQKPIQTNRDTILDSRYVNTKLYNIEYFEDAVKPIVTQPIATPTSTAPVVSPTATPQIQTAAVPVVHTPTEAKLNRSVVAQQASSLAPATQIVLKDSPSPQIAPIISEKDELVRLSQAVILEYLEKNPECRQKIMAKDGDFYKRFENSYTNYMKLGFQQTIGYVPNSSDIQAMNINEAKTFINLYRKMPDCTTLIQKYSTLVIPPKIITAQAPKDDLLTQSAPSEQKDIDIEKQKKYIKQQYEEKKEKDQNRLFQYILNMDKNLQTLTSRVDGLKHQEVETKNTLNNSYSLVNANVVNALDRQQNRFLEAEREISQGVAKDQVLPLAPIAEDDNKYLEKKMIENKKKAMEQAPDYIKKGQQANSNFSYTPEYIPSGKQPSKEIYSAYGWSFMPPQSWSVPQKRPPVCIPQKGQASTVVPIYDKSVPVDALEWTQVGSILPKFEYKEVYNKDYYEPGYLAMDTPQYPFNPKHFKQEVYGYNFAEKIEK